MASRDNHEKGLERARADRATTAARSRGHVRIVQRPPSPTRRLPGGQRWYWSGGLPVLSSKRGPRETATRDGLEIWPREWPEETTSEEDSAGTGPEDYWCCLLRDGHERRPREMASKDGLENGQRNLPRRRTVLVLVRRTTGAVLYPTSRLTHHPTQRQPADRKVGSRDPRAMRA
jgi:hypothetical protein